MKRVVVLFLLAFVFLPQPAHAYNLEYWRWDHTCFTHDASPEITAALASWATVSGVTDCGISTNPDLSFAPPSAEQLAAWVPSQTIGGAETYLRPGTQIVARCVVKVAPAATALRAVWAHEVGHCLGLNHSAIPGTIMAPAAAADFPQPDDIAGIQRLYGPRQLPLRFSVYAAEVR